MISYSTEVRVKRSLRAGSTLPLAWSAGIAALVAGCAQLHAAFGMLLCALVVLRFMPQLRDLGPGDATQIRQLARCTSRLIYLMLYSVLFLKFFAELTTFSWHDEGLALRALGPLPQSRKGPRHDPPNDGGDRALPYLQRLPHMGSRA